MRTKKYKATLPQIKTFVVTGVFLWICFSNSYGQREDLQLRAGASISGELLNKVDWSFDAQQRLRNNMSMFDQFQLEPGISYTPYKFLKLGLNYRYIYKLSSKLQYESRQRISFDAGLRQKLDRVKVGYRTRLQYGFEDFINKEQLGLKAFIQRHAFGIEYDIFGSRFAPSVKYEIYHHLNNPAGNHITKTRWTFGTDIYINPYSSLEVYYLINKEVNLPDPLTEYVVGITYKYSL